MARYERPLIQTLDSSQIVEMMGPAQGYTGPGGGSHDTVESTSQGSPDSWHPAFR